MLRPFFPSLLITIVSLSACGTDAPCSGDSCDVGECNAQNLGRDLVQMPNGRLAYAGQAILLQTCANGCHNSQASGAARQDAPEGLDFDLAPLLLGESELGEADVAGLRARQKLIFDQRDEIWREVRQGRMPAGEGFEKLSLGHHVQSEPGMCARGDAVAPLEDEATQELLRAWLACGAPLVEAEGDVPMPEGGLVGDRYPSCDVEPLEPTFENVYQLFGEEGCALTGCHGTGTAQAGLDLGTLDAAYLSLVGTGTGQPSTCGGASYVTPGNVAESYLITKLGGEGVRCGLLMPPAGKLGTARIELIAQWILAGAPAPN